LGSSVPNSGLNEKVNSRSLTSSTAAGQREEYLLSVFKKCSFDAIFFLTTAFGKAKGSFSTEETVSDSVRYVSLGYIGGNKYIRYISSVLYALTWIMRNIKSGDVVVVYNFPIVFAVPLILRKFFIKYKLIIDFEDFFNSKDIRYYIVHPFERLGIYFSDGFIASSPFMAKYIKSRKKASDIHVNGGYDSNPITDIHRKSIKSHIQLLYSGSLTDTRGVLDLLSAFSANLDQRYRLVLTGSGPLEAEVKKARDLDSRIEFLGNLSETAYFDVINNSDICINSQWESIMINFPSKVTMYLSFGKCVLSTRHDALTQSKYSEMISFYDQTQSGFWENINDMTESCSFSEQDEYKRIEKYRLFTNKQRVELVDFMNKYSID